MSAFNDTLIEGEGVRWGGRRLGPTPRIGRAAVVAALLALGLLYVLRSLETAIIYVPARQLVARPADFNLAADDLWLTTSDGVRLHGWWIHGLGRRVLVWCHGNADNISHRLEDARLLVQRLGLDIVLVDYRGYGQSEGRPSESGLYADGRAMYEVAIQRGFRPEQVVLYGRSLGAAVALDVALGRPAGAVILETPFTSIRAMARLLLPLVPGSLIGHRYDSEQKIGRLAAPKLIIQAEADDVVPPEHARRLYDLAAPPKQFYSIPGAHHSDTHIAGGQAYLATWERFLNQ